MTKRMHDNLQEKYKSSVTVCSYNVTYAFQSESTLYICLNVKELLAQNKRDIGTLSDCNGTRTRNHLVRKRTLNHLAKLGSSPLQSLKVVFFRFWNYAKRLAILILIRQLWKQYIGLCNCFKIKSKKEFH